MGLATVGDPADRFEEPFATELKEIFAAYYDGIVLDSDEEDCCSLDLPWTGWGILQQVTIDTVGEEAAPHFLSMGHSFGCYVPVETEITSFQFDGEHKPLSVAGLSELIAKLENLGRALGLATDEAELKALSRKYQPNDMIDEDYDIQTYAELRLAAQVAQRRHQILWIVK